MIKKSIFTSCVKSEPGSVQNESSTCISSPESWTIPRFGQLLVLHATPMSNTQLPCPILNPQVQPAAPTFNPAALCLTLKPCVQPYTRNPGPSTPNPKPQTVNPKPSTLNPRPQTLDPKPCRDISLTRNPNLPRTSIGP